MIALSPPPLLLTAALTAQTVVLRGVESLQVKPSPPPHLPKPPSSGGLTAACPRDGRSSGRQKPLRAYTAAEVNNNNPWRSFMKFPTSFTELFEAQADAPLSVEEPIMLNLEVESKDAGFDAEKEGLLAELKALTKTFDDLQSSMDYKSQLYSATIKGYESKIGKLEDRNVLLQKGLEVLTMTLEHQEKQIKKLQREKEDSAAKEGKRANEDIEVKNLEEENDTLKQRLRFLEVELSDIAFESRKAATADTSSAKQTDGVQSGAEVAATTPNAPVPPHVYQQRQLEQLQRQVDKYRRERSSVRKLFGLGICRGIAKVGRALNLWSPVYNLVLWGELKGQGKAVV